MSTTLMRGLTVAMLSMSGMVAPAAQAQVKSGYVSPGSPATLLAPIKRQGLTARLVTDGKGVPRIESRASRSNFSVFFFGCGDPAGCSSIQFSAWYRSRTPVRDGAINGFNRDFRYANAFTDTDGQAVVTYDLWMGGPGLTDADFADAVDLWVELLKEFEVAIDW